MSTVGSDGHRPSGGSTQPLQPLGPVEATPAQSADQPEKTPPLKLDTPVQHLGGKIASSAMPSESTGKAGKTGLLNQEAEARMRALLHRMDGREVSLRDKLQLRPLPPAQVLEQDPVSENIPDAWLVDDKLLQERLVAPSEAKSLLHSLNPYNWFSRKSTAERHVAPAPEPKKEKTTWGAIYKVSSWLLTNLSSFNRLIGVLSAVYKQSRSGEPSQPQTFNLKQLQLPFSNTSMEDVAVNVHRVLLVRKGEMETVTVWEKDAQGVLQSHTEEREAEQTHLKIEADLSGKAIVSSHPLLEVGISLSSVDLSMVFPNTQLLEAILNSGSLYTNLGRLLWNYKNLGGLLTPSQCQISIHQGRCSVHTPEHPGTGGELQIHHLDLDFDRFPKQMLKATLCKWPRLPATWTSQVKSANLRRLCLSSIWKISS